jgi:hypothetical protein
MAVFQNIISLRMLLVLQAPKNENAMGLDLERSVLQRKVYLVTVKFSLKLSIVWPPEVLKFKHVQKLRVKILSPEKV